MDSLEVFAWLCATLDTGLVERDHALASAGLNEAKWSALCDEWLPRLAASDRADLAVRFAGAYGRARQEQRHEPAPLVQSVLAPDSSSVGRPLEITGDDTEENPAPPPGCTADQTLEMPFAAVGRSVPVMPFRPASPPSPSSSSPVTHPRDTERLQSSTAGVAERTVEIPPGSPGGGSALPFAAAASGRQQRLVRFDTRTGAPLAHPYLVDDPTPQLPVRGTS